MRKYKAIFAVAAGVIVLFCTAALILFNIQENVPVREVPDFVLPESTAALTEEPCSLASTEESAAATAETREPQDLPSDTAESVPAPLPANVQLTSCDPKHFISLEFNRDRIMFSGVYFRESIAKVLVLNRKISCNDLVYSESGFSGSIDASGLEEGYHILRFKTASGSIMDYVFEVTEQGTQPLPEDKLPSERNISVTEAPLEIPGDTVLKLITADGDRERAAEVLQTVRDISDAVCTGIVGELDKARALAEWTSENIYYDHDARDTGVTDDMVTLEYVLKYHRSVCYGWTNLYSALCQAQGIDCLNVNGSIVTESRCFLQTMPADERAHSWNLLMIDGEKIWVDTVWNSSNNYEDGQYYQGNTDLQYFGITNASLAQDHRAVRCERRDYFGAVG